MHPGNGELMRVLGEARKRTMDASSTLTALAALLTDMAGRPDAAERGCSGLVDVLGADAAWVVDGGGIAASHRSIRAGSAPVPDVQPVAVAATFDGVSARRRDGRRSLALAPTAGR
ncbi:MAG TPA: hypothetical protein VKV34_05090, partial [Thermoleophilia bacterium]|nr:hypothetical protein [Thermoleophilia bacterium]